MKQVIAKMNQANVDEVNPRIFSRQEDKSIEDYIINGTFKQAEVLPFIKLLKYEVITDATKIHSPLNRRYLKNKEIEKDKSITKLVSTKESACNLLKAHLEICYKGEYRQIVAKLLVPAYVDNNHLLIDGHKILVINQIVDQSTYTTKNALILKTALAPIVVTKRKVKGFEFVSTAGKDLNGPQYILNVFSKEFNPLYYYLARFGITKTIKYFNLSDIIDFVEEEYDTEIYHYIKVNKNLYMEIRKDYYKEFNYVRIFSRMFYETMTSKMNMSKLDDLDHWKKRLGSKFISTVKSQVAKAEQVSISFRRILDATTKEMMRIDDRHLKSTYSLIRWMLQNYGDLRKKDNYSLDFKRVRANELIAASFNMQMSNKINNLLKKKSLRIDTIDKIFNWNEGDFLKSLIYGKYPCSALHYDLDVNSNTAINACRYTKLGLAGIPGGNGAPLMARNLHSSYLGRTDLTFFTHGKNVGLNGLLCPFTKIYEGGYFTEEPSDPDNFIGQLKEVHKHVDMNITDDKRKRIKAVRDRKYIHMLERERLINIERSKSYDGLTYMVPKMSPLSRGQHGYSVTIQKSGIPPHYIDEAGRIVLVETNTFFIPKSRVISEAMGNTHIVPKLKCAPVVEKSHKVEKFNVPTE